jgi:hypothetical protein
MLKRGYMILIGGASLFVIGVILTSVYGISMANIILNESTVLENVEIGPSESVNHTLDINSIERPISVALQVWPVLDSNIDSSSSLSSSQRPTIEQLVVNPDGVIVNKNQLSGEAQRELLTSFRPDTEGLYTLILSNLGTETVTVSGLFGFLPISDANGLIDLNAVMGVAAGSIITIIGVLTLIVGTIIVVFDWRRGKKPTRSTFDWGR